MAAIEIQVPDIGDFKDVAVIEVLVQPGDTVRAEQSLFTVESDKASMEIPSSHAGVVKKMRMKVGDKVSQGSVMLTLEVEGGAAATPLPQAGEGQGVRAAVAPSPQPSPAGGRGSEPAPVAATYSGGADLECDVLAGFALGRAA